MCYSSLDTHMANFRDIMKMECTIVVRVVSVLKGLCKENVGYTDG